MDDPDMPNGTHTMRPNGDVTPAVPGPDGRALENGAVATGYPTTAPSRGGLEQHIASVEADRANYVRAGNDAGVAACDEDIAATRARLNDGAR